CGDEFRYWTGYPLGDEVGHPGHLGVGPRRYLNAYGLEDAHGNTTFGFTSTSATQPASNLEVAFLDQTTTGPDFAGYTLQARWHDDPVMPQGTYTSTLQVSYPDDPAGDWAAGSVSHTITYELEGGSTHLLVRKQTYDSRFGVDDLPFALTVPPGAGEGGMPKTTDGTTPRLVLLALTGTRVPQDVIDGGLREPSPEPGWAWRQIGGQWEWLEDAEWDVALEQADQPELRLSLVDGNGQLVPSGAFRVHRCPRFDHSTPTGPLPPCTLAPVESSDGVVASIVLNPNGLGDGGSRGYLGIELTRAPVAPGGYYVYVESLNGTEYLIHNQADLVPTRSSPDDDFRGAFAICTVMGGEFLDENFQRIDPLQVHAWPTRAYVRFREPSGAAEEITAEVAYSEGGPVLSSTTAQLGRLGVARAGATEYLGPLYLAPSTGSCPIPSGMARATNLPSEALLVFRGDLSAYLGGALRARSLVDALPRVSLAINNTAEAADDFVTVHPDLPTDVLVGATEGCYQLELSVEPAGIAVVMPSTVTIGEGESATVQLFAIDRSAAPKDVSLVARVGGTILLIRPFTCIDAEVTSADITVEPEQEGISLQLHPPGMEGIQLTLDLVRPDSTTFTLVNAEPRNGGEQSEAFQIASLPTMENGEFVTVRARWGLGGRNAEYSLNYHFHNLGRWTHTEYNTPLETGCDGAPVEVCVTDSACGFQIAAMRAGFVSEVGQNGSGISATFGPVQTESFCVPAGCGGRPAFRTVPSIDGACLRPARQGVTLAGGDGTLLAVPANCGVRAFVVGVGIKQVEDRCPACSNANHVDNYIGPGPCDFAQGPVELQTIKLW
ncbi:MAG: hypothetical protein HY858_16965, partial [Candidatus Solibacter usitatus]|nr:hypothetical protein [Candidatus Solibacter usitatus]